MAPTAPRLAVSAGIWRRGRVLLIRRAKPPLFDLWTFPGGHVEAGEPVLDAIRREVLEETGLSVEIVGEPLLHEIFHRSADGTLSSHHVLLVFAGRPLTETEPVAASDAAEASFVDPAVLPGLATTPRLAHFVSGTAVRLGLSPPWAPE